MCLVSHGWSSICWLTPPSPNRGRRWEPDDLQQQATPPEPRAGATQDRGPLENKTLGDAAREDISVGGVGCLIPGLVLQEGWAGQGRATGRRAEKPAFSASSAAFLAEKYSRSWPSRARWCRHTFCERSFTRGGSWAARTWLWSACVRGLVCFGRCPGFVGSRGGGHGTLLLLVVVLGGRWW